MNSKGLNRNVWVLILNRTLFGTILGFALALFMFPNSAMAYKAYNLHDDKWAIECNDGSIWSYSGSAAGLSTVGPALCADHGGIANPRGNPQVREIQDPVSATPALAEKGYPPHGYPCLGCYPCPPSYCDNDNKRVVWDPNWSPAQKAEAKAKFDAQAKVNAKKKEDCKNTGGVWAGEDGKGGCTRPPIK